MKKVISLLLALVLCLSLCACGGSTNNTTTPPTADSEASDSNTADTEATDTETADTESTDSETADTETTKSDEITLTLENYKKYLKIKHYFGTSLELKDALYCQSANNGLGVEYDGGYTWYLYNRIDSAVWISGASTNFIYNDIVLTVRFTGTYDAYYFDDYDKTMPIEMDVTIECDIGGNGYAEGYFYLADKYYTYDEFINYNWEIVSISGTVSKA